MKHYLVLAMRTSAFAPDVIEPHLAFLDQLRAQGRLHMTGGFSDQTGGAYVLANVGSLAEAQAIVAGDPLVLTGSSLLTVHEWNTR